MYGYIYETTCIPTGKKYIGMHKWNKDSIDVNYLGSGLLLTKVINKYGKENFSSIILEKCETLDELNDAEIKWISKFDAVNSDNYYNIARGGEGHTCDPWNKGKHIPLNPNSAKGLEYGRHLPASDNLKKKLSEIRTGILVSDDTREKLRKAQSGKRYVNNGIMNKCISEVDLDNYLNDGWKLGKLPKDYSDRIRKFKETHYNKDNTEWKNNIRKSIVGRKWVTNGLIDKQIKSEEVDYYLSIGFKLGRCKVRNKLQSSTTNRGIGVDLK